MSCSQTATLTLPGAATSTLRNINRLWNIHDASMAVPYSLHPRGEHRANQWGTVFQSKLEVIVKIAHPDEIREIKQHMQRVVFRRCQGRPTRVKYMTVADLIVVLRYVKRKRREEDVRAAEMNAARELQQRLVAQQHQIPAYAISLPARYPLSKNIIFRVCSS
jgi:hypothetical protein